MVPGETSFPNMLRNIRKGGCLYILLALLLYLSIPITAHAATIQRTVYVTCYTATGNPCANGEYPEVGIVAYSPQYIDDYIVRMWAEDGAFIGEFEIWDTGNPKIQEGHVIDVYQDTLEDCQLFAQTYSSKVHIDVIDKEEYYNDRSQNRVTGNPEDSCRECLRYGAASEGRLYFNP